jgi:murein DD-endopeptidase MepM/ murein hydrolase activator NlpD
MMRQLCALVATTWTGAMVLAHSALAKVNRLETFVFNITENRIEFSTQDEVQPKGQIIESPTRLVIDLPGTVFHRSTIKRTIGTAVQEVRVGQPEPGTTRLVVEFAPDFKMGNEPLFLKAVSPKHWAVDLPSHLAAATQRAKSGFIWPLIGELTAGFGWRIHPISGERRLHKGIDIAAPIGTPIFAAADGVVLEAGWDEGGYGNKVVIQHPDGSETLYAHNNRLFVSPGQLVKQGQPIAEVGSTGRSTGPHLHFEVSKAQQLLDPMAILPLRYILFDVAAS